MPSISFTNATGAGLSATSSGTLSISSGSSGAGIAQIVLNAAGNQIQFPSFPYNMAGILHTSALGVLSTSAVSLTTDVSGVLPIANGGTNSSNTLNNNRIMVSSGGKIVESDALSNGQLLIGSTGAAPVVANITQASANQVIVTNGAGSITLSLPQDIATTSSPTFASQTLSSTSDQLTLGSGETITLSAPAPEASITYYIPDVLTTSTFVMTDGNQTINGNKTFSGTTNLSALTPSLPLQLDASNNIISAPLTPASFSGVLTVTQGGTGSSALGMNAMLASNATGTAIIPLANLTNGQIFIGSNGAEPVAATIAGTVNQINVANGAGTITLSTPQDIATTSSPTFASETLTSTLNQLTLGTTNQTIINATAPAATRTYTIPDTGANSSFVMTDGNQTINGNKTFSGTTNLSALTPSLPLQLDASNNIISAPLTPASFSGVLTVTQGGTGSSALGMNAMLASNATGTAIIPLANLTNGQIFIGSNGAEPVAATIAGTVNQINVANGAGTITLSTPQDIATTSSPTFASETLTSTLNQLTLGTTNQTIINATAPAATRTYTIPDTGANSSFVMTDGNQTINGNKTFSGTTNLSALTPSLPLQLDASNNIISAPLTPASFSGVLTVTQGGTGSSSLGMNAMLASNATGTAIIPLVNLTNGQIFIGSNGTEPIAAQIQSTANQTTVTNGAGSIQIGTVQDIGVTSSPTFASETLANTSNQLTLGSGETITLSAPTPEASITYYIPDVLTTSTFVMVDGTQTINGLKSFNNTVNMLGQNALDFYDATNTHFVGIQAPSAVTSSYTFALPATAPTTVGQVLSSISASATQWASTGGSGTTQTIYVAVNGNDITGNGSFIAPYASLKRALADANTAASPTNPVQISIGAGIFTENNSAGPLQVTASPINIAGASSSTTTLIASTTTQDFLSLPVTTNIRDLTVTGATGATGIVCTNAGNNSIFLNMVIEGCGEGFNLSGGTTTQYYFSGVAEIACGIGKVVNNAYAVLYNSSFLGSTSIPTPQYAGFLATGPDTLVLLDAAAFLYCTTGAQVSNGANVQFIGCSFTGNNVAMQCDSQSTTASNASTYIFNNNINMNVQDDGTKLQATSCNVNGLSSTNIPMGIGLQATNGAQVTIAASSFNNLVDGIITGSSTDTYSAQVIATGVTVANCTDEQLIQNTISTIDFIGGSYNRGQIVINTSGNATFNSSDTSSNNATVIGQHSYAVQDIILFDTGAATLPALTYQSNYNGARGTVYINQTTSPAVFGVNAPNDDAQLSAVTAQNTQAASVQLYSGNIGSIPGFPAAGNTNIRGWEMIKTSTTADLAFNFVNNDVIGSTTVTQYTSFYVDGFNNILNFPTASGAYPPTNATTVLNWAGDTNLYRASAGLLQTDDQLAIGTLNASSSGFALTASSPGNVVQVSPTTATQIGYLSNVTSDVQTQINGKLSLTGGTLTGPLTLPDGTSSMPSLNFAGYPGTGLSATGGVLALDTNASPAITINQDGNVTINQASSGTTLTVTGGGASISGNLTIPSGTGIITTDAITINNAPVAGTDGANKAYVDSVAVGLQVKSPCNLVATAPDGNIDLSGFPTIDSVVTSTGFRVLLTDETDGVENGIWQINSGGVWARPSDFPTGGDAHSAYTFITEGAVYANSSWICTNTIGNDTIDTNTLYWTEFSAPQNITGANIGSGAGVFANKVGSH